MLYGPSGPHSSTVESLHTASGPAIEHGGSGGSCVNVREQVLLEPSASEVNVSVYVPLSNTSMNRPDASNPLGPVQSYCSSSSGPGPYHSSGMHDASGPSMLQSGPSVAGCAGRTAIAAAE